MADELRQYVKSSILEYYGFDPGPDRLAKAFGLTGLMDIGKTMIYGLERMSSKAQHLIGVVASGLSATLLPFAEGSYEEIDQAEKRRSEAIKSKYADVFDRVDKEFYEDDFRVAAFLYNPVSYISTLAGVRAPGAALDILDTISGRNSYVAAFTDAVRGKFNITSAYKKYGGKRNVSSDNNSFEDSLADMFGESVERQTLLEAGLTPKNMMKMVMGQEKIRKILTHSKYIKTMRADAEKMIKQYVNDVVNHTKKIIQSLSLDEIIKMSKGKIDASAFDRLEAQEKRKAEEALNEHAKGVVKEVAKKKLTQNANLLPNELKALLQRGVEAIESL